MESRLWTFAPNNSSGERNLLALIPRDNSVLWLRVQKVSYFRTWELLSRVLVRIMSSFEEKSPAMTRRSQRRRNKTPSSLAGMFAAEESQASPVVEKEEFKGLKYSQSERVQLQEMSRKLRRAKRQLLLKSVEQPVRPVDKLRDILLQLSVDSTDDDDNLSKDSASTYGYPWPPASPTPSFD